MMDFFRVSVRSSKKGCTEIYPKFIVRKSNDLMIRGGDFYAIWVEELGLWSTDEDDAQRLIDRELDLYFQENRDKLTGTVKVLHLWDAETGMIDTWHKYCQKQMRDNFSMLDEKLIFSNTGTGKKDYASKRLDYPLEAGRTEAYDRLMSVLYSPEERHKLEWAIGSVVTGDSKKLQKFLVLYGAAGTGKSTVLNIIQQLFEGYYAVFDAKALGSSTNAFALEAFKSNPLVAIQHDGDLSRIEDNTRLNSLVSHEIMTVNEKYKSTYANRFKALLFMGTNKPVRITDAKSGLIRRLIDVSPTGNKVPAAEYRKLVGQIPFELGGIAWHCREVYLQEPGAYDDYIPLSMLSASNDFYNFVAESYSVFRDEDGTTLKAAWEMYKTWCTDAKVNYPYSQRVFKEELKNYFREYSERYTTESGARVRSRYSGFRTEKFEEAQEPEQKPPSLLELNCETSLLDDICADCPAQYGDETGKPHAKWARVKTKLRDLDTKKLHYVRLPENHIVVDFDIPDGAGNKCLKRNLEAAAKWPPTYAELSKSGQGVHLHYIYSGDASGLSRVYDDHIEVKVFTGNSSLRRKLSKCNNLPLATISSGLPTKGEKPMVNFDAVKSEKGLRTLIKRNLCKEIHPATKPSVDFIYKILEDAYASGLHYDVTDLRPAVLAFAAGSTHQAANCLKLVSKMRFQSAEASEGTPSSDGSLIFFDTEVFPNLFLVNWKAEGEGKPVVRMINPTPEEIENLLREADGTPRKLVGFNCRRYDNHILYARLMGYTNEQLYKLSQRIINGSANCFFGEAYNLSYTDIYDFSSKKQSLKKFEIELGIHHQELGLPWDQPVPEEQWEKVAEYCDNDVIATEAVFNARHADFVAREILADVAGMTVNDTTNSLTTRIIFGKNRTPQDQFRYRDMGDTNVSFMKEGGYDEYTVFDLNGRPIFPGYTYEFGKSTYRGEEVGEGGYVYAEPGMYGDVALLDIASMHPSSIVAEELFGPTYTKRFQEILEARIAIKHQDFDKARTMLDGKLAKYLTDENAAADLAQALKIAINSVYGLTAAGFENPFRDPRNKDNIVAKRGALFMVNLKHEVQKRGFIVAHIKTDSIKIPDATPEIIQFVMDYGKLYGYNFEHEATYERMCLVNDAVYIARYAEEQFCENVYGYIPKDCRKHPGEWTATGKQFAVPYVFKTLFTHEDLTLEDMCETKSVSTALYLDFNEGLPEGEHNYIFIGKVGQFCPVKEGCGGGLLLRQTVNSKTGETGYSAPAGTLDKNTKEPYRWKEAEVVRQLGSLDDVDQRYYKLLVDEAYDAIDKQGDAEWFCDTDRAYLHAEYDEEGRPLYEVDLPF